MPEYEKYEQQKPTEQESTKTEVHNYYSDTWGWCMGPVGAGRRSISGFWGVVLLATGGAWLAANIFDFEDWGRWAGSLILVALGLWYLARATSRESDK